MDATGFASSDRTADDPDQVARQIGRLLREARRARHESREQAADRLHVTPAYLASLEQGQFALKAIRPFILVLLRAYANHLGLDGNALVAPLRPARLPPMETMPDDWVRRLGSRRGLRVVAVVSLLILGTAMLGWRSREDAPQELLQAGADAPLGLPSESLPAVNRTKVEERVATAPAITTEASPPLAPDRVPDPVESHEPPPSVTRIPLAATTTALDPRTTERPVPKDAPSGTARATTAPTGPKEKSGAGEAVPPTTGTGAGLAIATRDVAAPIAAPDMLKPMIESATRRAPPEARRGFAIQLASLRDPARVPIAWRHLVERHPTLRDLAPRPPRKVQIRDRGTFYRVLGGSFASQADARAACDRLRAEGGACSVVAVP